MLCSYNGLIANEQAQVDSQLLELWLAAIAIVFYRVLILVLEIGVDPYVGGPQSGLFEQFPQRGLFFGFAQIQMSFR